MERLLSIPDGEAEQTFKALEQSNIFYASLSRLTMQALVHPVKILHKNVKQFYHNSRTYLLTEQYE